MKIIKIEGNDVFIGTEDNRFVKVPIGYLNFQDPQIGDKVKVYKGENDMIIITRNQPAKAEMEQMLKTGPGRGSDDETPRRLSAAAAQQTAAQYNIAERRCNKHIFVWVCNFLFGALGVDRFMRGQIGLGILNAVIG